MGLIDGLLVLTLGSDRHIAEQSRATVVLVTVQQPSDCTLVQSFSFVREPVTGMEARNFYNSEAHDHSLIVTDRAVKRREPVMDLLSWQRTPSRLWKKTSRRLESTHLRTRSAVLSNVPLCEGPCGAYGR